MWMPIGSFPFTPICVSKKPGFIPVYPSVCFKETKIFSMRGKKFTRKERIFKITFCNLQQNNYVYNTYTKTCMNIVMGNFVMEV